MLLLVTAQTGCSNLHNSEKESSSSEDVSLPAVSQTAQWPNKEWDVSAPEEQGIDSELLEKADQRIQENYPNVYSLLVVRNGFLVYEKYYQGMDKDSYNPVYSVTKSVMSALTGIAIEKNILNNTDQKVSELIPEYFVSIDNEKKKDITLENVLTMTGGLESIDNNYPGYYSSYDWLDYALCKPLVDEPGDKFVYNTGLTHFLSGVITEKSEMGTKKFAEKYLFNPINIKVKRWDYDSRKCYGGGAGLYLTPQDMAKFGYLYLNKGNWDGKQIIPEEWVTESTSKHISTDSGFDYGYLFWIYDSKNANTGKTFSTYSALGAGGQKIIIIPDLDLIVVITADYYSASLDGSDDELLVQDYVLPAIK